MDRREVIELVKEYSKVVVANMNVNKIVLFGSYAKGTNTKYSDIDVAVIVPADSLSANILEDMIKLCKLRRNISIDIEPVLLVDEEDPSGFIDSIMEYGEVVYSK